MRAVPAQLAARLSPAAQLFADRGLDNTKIEDVAVATGVPKATLYYYFASKEEILAHLLQHALARISEAVAVAATREGTAAERLQAVIAAQLAVMAEQPAVCRALIGDLGRAGRIPEIARALNQAYYQPVEALLTEGVLDGSLTAQKDPVAAAMGLFGATTISGLAFLIAGQDLEPDAVSAAVYDLVFNGLRPR
jgi:TetR/AcrR family transcriptional regulator